jgi:hypothetical protein
MEGWEELMQAKWRAVQRVALVRERSLQMEEGGQRVEVDGLRQRERMQAVAREGVAAEHMAE